MQRLGGKVVFLTGAGGALGGASARLFAMEGARIAVVDAREDAAQATVKRLSCGFLCWCGSMCRRRR